MPSKAHNLWKWVAALPDPVFAGIAAGLGVCLQAVFLEEQGGTLILGERLMCAGLIPFLLILLLLRALRTLRPREIKRRTWILSGMLLAALAVRLAIPPILLHVEFVGLKYVGMAMDLASTSGQDGSYGQAGFLTQGLLAHALGGSLRAFFVGNALVSVAAIGLAAALLSRWTRGSLAAPAVLIVLAGLNPLLVRTGASEDVHVVGAFYTLLSLLFLEMHCQDGRRGDLLIAVAAAILATCSRQFLLPMPVLFVLLYIERKSFKDIFRAPAAAGGFALLLLGAVIRWSVLVPGLASGAAGAQYGGGGQWLQMLHTYLIIAGQSLGEPHPLIDQSLFPVPLALLLLAGLYAILRRRTAPRSIFLAWLYLLLLSLGTSFGGIQVRYLFRILFMYLTVLIAALGWEVVHRWLQERWRTWLASAGLVLLGVAVPAALAVPTIVRDSAQDPFTRQVLFIDSVAARLPEEFLLIKLDRQDLADDNLYLGLPRFLWERHEKRADIRPLRSWQEGIPGYPADAPVYLFRGVECYSLSIFETDPAWRRPDDIVSRADAEELSRFFRAEHPGDERILESRRACFSDADFQIGSDDLSLTIDPGGFTPGNMFYVQKPFTIGFRRLPDRAPH